MHPPTRTPARSFARRGERPRRRGSGSRFREDPPGESRIRSRIRRRAQCIEGHIDAARNIFIAVRIDDENSPFHDLTSTQLEQQQVACPNVVRRLAGINANVSIPTCGNQVNDCVSYEVAPNLRLKGLPDGSLVEAGHHRSQPSLRSGRHDPGEVLQAVLKRIDEVDPLVNALRLSMRRAPVRPRRRATPDGRTGALLGCSTAQR